MIRFSLPDNDLQRLEDVLRTADDPKLRHRVQIVVMAHRGRRHPDIAADTGPSPTSSRSSASGGSTVQPNKDWTGRTGPTPNGPTTCSRPKHPGWPVRPPGVWGEARHPPVPADVPVSSRRPGQNSLCYFQTMKGRIKTRPNRRAKKRTASPGT